MWYNNLALLGMESVSTSYIFNCYISKWSCNVLFVIYYNTTEMPNHFTLLFFFRCERHDVSCSHSNRDLFTREDNMLFSHVKISCFHAKAHLVFHWYLYNK